jgi:Fic family protein
VKSLSSIPLAHLDIFGYNLDMKDLIKKIEKLQKEINFHKPFDEEILRTWQEKLRIDWTYNSNAIEGNTLTYGETAFFLREGLTSEGKPFKDYLETKNHAEAIEFLYDFINNNRNLTEGFIKELHALLLKDVEFTYAKNSDGKLVKKPLTPGKYKTRPNHVLTISGKIHKYIEPIKVPEEMEKLLEWFKKKEISIVEKAALFHYKFVAIHPFDDGNGRIARLLMNLILMKAEYPPCIIKNIHRKKYLESLTKADLEKDFNPFVRFIYSELVNTQTLMLDILKGKEVPEEAKRKSPNRVQRVNMIMSLIGEEPLSIGQIWEELSEIKRPTLKSDLKLLLKTKKIKSKGKGSGVLYYR